MSSQSNVVPFPAPAKVAKAGVHLSARERQLAELIAEDLPDKEIAYRLGLSTNTIKVYSMRLRFKIGADSKVGIAVWWVRHGEAMYLRRAA